MRASSRLAASRVRAGPILVGVRGAVDAVLGLEHPGVRYPILDEHVGRAAPAATGTSRPASRSPPAPWYGFGRPPGLCLACEVPSSTPSPAPVLPQLVAILAVTASDPER